MQPYCRSKQTLIKLLPEAAENNYVKVFEGHLENVELLEECMRGTRAVFLAVAVTENVPGCSIAIDTANVVIQALKQMKKRQTKLPKLVVLSSASLEPKFMSDDPKLGRSVALCAFSNIYKHLAVAE